MIGDGDLEKVFTNGDFDDEAIFNGSLKIRGWFTDATTQTSILTNEVETVNPSFVCATSAITAVKHKDTVVIRSKTYIVERNERIGNGSSMLYLKT